jgi:hypothetical protein
MENDSVSVCTANIHTDKHFLILLEKNICSSSFKVLGFQFRLEA